MWGKFTVYMIFFGHTYHRSDKFANKECILNYLITVYSLEAYTQNFNDIFQLNSIQQGIMFL